jgi:predicted transcriptional regulator
MSRREFHVGRTLEDMKRRVVGAVERAKRGESGGEEHASFESWEAIASVMTTKRFALLRHLHRTPEASIASLARSLRRDYMRVHEDVEVLCQAGLIDRSSDGLRAEYDEIRTLIAL